jgi:hypothetical protein
MINKVFQFYNTDESTLPPPVPPRRRKCKAEPKRSSITNPNTIKPERKYREIPSPPHPTVPQRLRAGKKALPPFRNKNYLSTIKTTNNELEYDYTNHNAISKTNRHDSKDFQTHKLKHGNSEEEKEGKEKQVENENYLKLRKANEHRSYLPFSKSPEPNKYPSLYFTLEDYEQVMEESIKQSNLVIQEVTNEINKNEEFADFPFMENVLFDNEREEIYFHVSTTNKPFEKCLNNFSNLNIDVDDCKKEDCTDLYIFEDYIDRSNRLNARPSLLFNDDVFINNQNDETASTARSATKVRFIIESPITSFDSDLDDCFKNYENYVDTVGRKQLAQLEDIDNEKLDENIGNTNNIHRILNNIENDKDKDVSKNLSILKINNPIELQMDSGNNLTGTVYAASQINIEEIDTDKNMVKNEDYKFESHNKYIKSKNKKELLYREIYNKSDFDIVSNNDSNENLNFPNERKDKKVDSISQNSIFQTMDSAKDYVDILENVENVEQIRESLDNFMQDTLSVEENSSKNILINQTLSVCKQSVPVSLHRNTFLEAMLSENQFYSTPNSSVTPSINCEIIATHPKEDPNVELDHKQNTIVAPSSNFAITLTDNVSKPHILSKSNVNPYNSKSAGDIKHDMLNELLTNFNSIKLRSVYTNNKVLHLEDLSKQDTVIEKFFETKTDNIDKIRQEQTDVKEVDNANSNINLNLDLLDLEKESRDINFNNKDACAIVTETAYTYCNANDNKVMTPVVVSNDQYCEAVSITPGSVKNFIKYYEIHSEISSISKIRDNTYKKQNHEFTRKDIRVNNEKKLTKADDNNKNISECSTTSKAEISITENERNNVTNKLNQVYSEYFPESADSSNHLIPKESCIKSLIINPAIERRKSVQFNSGCTVINPFKEEEQKTLNEHDNELVGVTRIRLKRRAPEKPNIKINEQPKGLNIDQQSSGSSSVNCIQVSHKLLFNNTKHFHFVFLPQTIFYFYYHK